MVDGELPLLDIISRNFYDCFMVYESFLLTERVNDQFIELVEHNEVLLIVDGVDEYSQCTQLLKPIHYLLFLQWLTAIMLQMGHLSE